MNAPDDIRPVSVRRQVLLVALAVFVADLVTKQVMLSWIFDPPQRVEILPFLNFVPVWNPGISFGMLADAGWAMPAILSALAFAVAGWILWKAPTFQRGERLAAGLIAGGAVGNALDRLRFGKVVDFIDVYVQTWHWPAFNIADAGITVGAVAWMASLFLERETDSK
ncbi:MAG: signal peptidase II [Pseudomonadota bacterium]|nr:signal peptidase II [Pseudomonadota bacterium]MEC7236585.1 signal peptidase II [Pseudomonadota bacterium]